MKRVRAWIAENELFAVAVLLLAIALILGVAGHIYDYHTLHLGKLLRDFYANASSELISIAITVLIIDQLNQRRADRREEAALKARLIRELGSQVNDVAVKAAEELRRYDWLQDDSLCGATLRGADLQGAALGQANLQMAYLYGANLQKTDLFGVNLQRATLREGDLQGARLVHADLHEARLGGANLHGADLGNANLQGTGLGGVNLQGANVVGAKFDENTKLPDGTKWTPNTDMARFTDPDHPDFWRSNDPDSPAYCAPSDE